MSTEILISLIVSITSIIIATLSLGWNVYRDIILKPRLRVTYGLRVALNQNSTDEEKLLFIGATNFGPDSIKIVHIHYKETSLFRKTIKRSRQGIITYDATNPYNSRLPCRIEVGDEIQLMFGLDQVEKWVEKITHIGLIDSFGRTHWANTKQVNEVKNRFQKFKAKQSFP